MLLYISKDVNKKTKGKENDSNYYNDDSITSNYD